jgi:hypothetical protein
MTAITKLTRTNKAMTPICPVHESELKWSNRYRKWLCRTPRCPEISIEKGPRRKRKPKPLMTIYDDGHIILRGEAWRNQKQAVWVRDGGCCAVCGKMVTSPNSDTEPLGEVHHRRSRGMSGGFRNDHMSNLELRCHSCHRKATPC